MLAIYKKELKSYFTSMIGYVFIAFFLVIFGLFYAVNNLASQVANIEYSLSYVSFFFVLLVPILTMRIMAEDKKQKTDQLLYTSPLTVEKIVMGKYLAVFTVFLIVIGIVCFYPLVLMQFGSVPLKAAYVSILGFALLGATYIAIGMFISTFTDSQLVAAVVTFVVVLITVFIDSLVSLIPSDNKSTWIILGAIIILICWITYLMMHKWILSLVVGVIGEVLLAIVYFVKPTWLDGLLVKVFGWFSVMRRFDNFIMNVMDLSSVIYYISVTFLFIFLTGQTVKKSRWN